MGVKTDITIDSNLILSAISLIMTTIFQLIQTIAKVRGEAPIDTWEELLTKNEELKQLIEQAPFPIPLPTPEQPPTPDQPGGAT